jgi:methylmalonyl-CoA mutase N-terminal domain/subunit
VVDPLGGSYFVENLTNEMERRVTDYITKIESLGGIVEAADKGWVHEEIADSAIQYQKAVESREMLVVGVNCHTMEDQPVEIFVQPETLNLQKAKLAELRKRRDETAVRMALDKIHETCGRMDNVMPSVIEATKSWVTVGEIADVFRQEWGCWDPPLPL